MKNNNIWVVIPTYWGENGTFEKPSQTCNFDHPTKVNGEQTLERTIENLSQFKDDFNILVLLAVTHDEFKKEAKEKVESILKKYKNKKNIYLISNDDVTNLSKQIPYYKINFKSYGSIRNVQLLIPYLAQCELVIAIDDDEVINEIDYFKKVSAIMEDKKIKGLSGVYLNKDESFLLKTEESTDLNPFIQKLSLINQVVSKAMNNKEQPHKSHVAFGGNMIFSRSIIENICFDDFVTRGEDFDYVINALCNNIDWHFDNNIPITHLPPNYQKKKNEIKCVRDIHRHIYTYYKIKNFKEDLKLPIYPDAFIKDIDQLLNYSIIAYMNESSCTKSTAKKIVEDINKECKKNERIYENQKDKWNKTIQYFQNNKSKLSFIKNSIETLKII